MTEGTHGRVSVYQEPGRFGGWPANHGIWSWGDEILVGFERAHYKAQEEGHSFDPHKPSGPVLARSLDSGESWAVEIPELPARSDEKPVPGPEGIDFAHPDLVIKCRDAGFHISYDRGKTWQGPYRLPDFGRKLTSRTDYIVNGSHDCLMFLSAFESKVEAGLQDRAFCVQTTDGGRSFAFLSWMTGEPIAVRSVMPSTVRGAKGQLISAMRRRHDRCLGGEVEMNCWIDVYRSTDDGQSWQFLSKGADTGMRNGNPPSLLRLMDGRLCLAYGYRATPYGIRAKLSHDEGETWEDEIVLRDDGRTWDLGYPRMVQRPDGKLVTIYYYSTAENPEQHIAATIWDAK